MFQEVDTEGFGEIGVWLRGTTPIWPSTKRLGFVPESLGIGFECCGAFGCMNRGQGGRSKPSLTRAASVGTVFGSRFGAFISIL